MKQTLPETVLNDARQRRGNTDAQAWEDADFVAGVVAEFTRKRGDRTRVIKELGIHMGISRASVSDLAQLSETYEVGVREAYREALTIGHYREAMRCIAVANPEKLLKHAVESADEWGGLPMPVDALRQHVRKLNAGLEVEKTKSELYRIYIDRAFKALGDALDYAPKNDVKGINSFREWLGKVQA